MLIKELRLSFIQLETLTGPLASLNAPGLPFKFLLLEGQYQLEAMQALAGGGARRPPWYGGRGKLFWFYYLEKKSAATAKPKDLWQGLVPFECEVPGVATPEWLSGSVELKGYLYPWGVGAVVDVVAKGSWSLQQAVELAFQVRSKGKYDWTAGGQAKAMPLDGLAEQAIASLRQEAYGPAIAAGEKGELFSLVTILDAEGADAEAPVADKQELHRALEACSGWSQYWQANTLKDLAQSRIEIKQSPPAHVLYGGRRGRVVWFPMAFRSSAANPGSLTCYHQNLMAATLQAESLCRFTQAVAGQLAGGQTLGQFSVTYGNCQRLAAGILGRLYGGSLKTYRSNSLRDQIRRTYLDALNSVRAGNGMPALT